MVNGFLKFGFLIFDEQCF